jgi:hypothetical protein
VPPCPTASPTASSHGDMHAKPRRHRADRAERLGGITRQHIPRDRARCTCSVIDELGALTAYLTGPASEGPHQGGAASCSPRAARRRHVVACLPDPRKESPPARTHVPDRLHPAALSEDSEVDMNPRRRLPRPRRPVRPHPQKDPPRRHRLYVLIDGDPTPMRHALHLLATTTSAPARDYGQPWRHRSEVA